MLQMFSDKQLIAYQTSTARINILEGAVRSGKSLILLVRWLDFLREAPPGDLAICGRTERTLKRNVINPLIDLVGSAVHYSMAKGEMTLFGRTIHVIGANDERAEAKIRGSTFAGALIDEATLMPENFFKMLLSRLSVAGAKLFASTNPDSPYHWLKRDFIDRKDELDLKTIKFKIHDNPSLSKEYIDNLCREYTGLWKKRYIDGEWVLAEGAVYDFFDEDIHVIDHVPGQADYYVVGIDYGTTNPCTFSLIGFTRNSYPNMWLEKEYYFDSKKDLRQKSDYDYTVDLLKFIAGYNVKHIYIDPSAASFKQEIFRHGVYNVFDAKNDVLPGIRFVGQLMTNGTFKVCSNCVETIKEFSNYLWDIKASQRGEDKPLKQSDHCLDSIRYALYTHFFNLPDGYGMTEEEAKDLEKRYRWIKNG